MRKVQYIWAAVPVPKTLQTGESWDTEISQIYLGCNDQNKICIQIRDLKDVHMRHFIMKKVALNANHSFEMFNQKNEPSYEEKACVLQALGKWGNIAYEVFPSTEKLVDAANLYHMWEEERFSLPFNFDMIQDEPTEWKKSRLLNIAYAIRVINTDIGKIAYLYLKGKEELKWAKKQKAKDEILGKYATAVEVISENFVRQDYSCLVALPMEYQLAFNLA